MVKYNLTIWLILIPLRQSICHDEVVGQKNGFRLLY